MVTHSMRARYALVLTCVYEVSVEVMRALFSAPRSLYILYTPVSPPFAKVLSALSTLALALLLSALRSPLYLGLRERRHRV